MGLVAVHWDFWLPGFAGLALGSPRGGGARVAREIGVEQFPYPVDNLRSLHFERTDVHEANDPALLEEHAIGDDLEAEQVPPLVSPPPRILPHSQSGECGWVILRFGPVERVTHRRRGAAGRLRRSVRRTRDDGRRVTPH